MKKFKYYFMGELVRQSYNVYKYCVVGHRNEKALQRHNIFCKAHNRKYEPQKAWYLVSCHSTKELADKALRQKILSCNKDISYSVEVLQNE